MTTTSPSRTAPTDHAAPAAASGPIIHLEQITKVFYAEDVETHALAEVDLEIRPGDYVAVARAVVGEPTIVLADEPTGNLDSKNGALVMDLLQGLHATGSTICMVTHDPRYAHRATSTLHLFDGRVVADAAPAV